MALWTPCRWLTRLKRIIRHLPSTAKNIYLGLFFFDECVVIRPVGPRPAGSARLQGRTPSQSPSWQTGWRNNPLVRGVNKSIPDCLDPWLEPSSNCCPLDEHHYAEVHAVRKLIQTDDPSLRSGLLSSSARAAGPSENRDQCLHCHEDTHSLSVDIPSQTLTAF